MRGARDIHSLIEFADAGTELIMRPATAEWTFNLSVSYACQYSLFTVLVLKK